MLIISSALAWLTLWWWGQSPYSRYLNHHSLSVATSNLGLLLLFVAGWVVMTGEKNLPGGDKMSKPLGLLLLVGGVTILSIGAP